MRQADAGEDPAQERADRKVGRYTFGELADEVLDARAMRTREATRRESARLLGKELLPVWGRRPAADITRREVRGECPVKRPTNPVALAAAAIRFDTARSERRPKTRAFREASERWIAQSAVAAALPT